MDYSMISIQCYYLVSEILTSVWNVQRPTQTLVKIYNRFVLSENKSFLTISKCVDVASKIGETFQKKLFISRQKCAPVILKS